MVCQNLGILVLVSIVVVVCLLVLLWRGLKKLALLVELRSGHIVLHVVVVSLVAGLVVLIDIWLVLRRSVAVILVLLLLLVVVSHLFLTWFVVSERTFRAVVIFAVIVECR